MQLAGGALAVVFAGALMHDSSSKVQAIKPRVGALFTFGQPRVGDFEFLCHLQVSLLEPSASTQPSSGTAHRAAPPAPDAAADGHAAAGANGGAAHHTQHALSAAGASKLRALMGKAQNEAAAPPLTSRYIRVVNTFDVSATGAGACVCRHRRATRARGATPLHSPVSYRPTPATAVGRLTHLQGNQHAAPCVRAFMQPIAALLHPPGCSRRRPGLF
jgi:hypothetical protein